VTRKLLITVLSIGLLIICVYFLVDSISQQSEQEALRTQITDAIEMIALIPEVPSDLQQRLTDAETSLVTEQSILLGQVNTTQVINGLLDIADANQVNVISLTTIPWSLINIEDYVYLVFTIHLDVKGNSDNLLALLRTLESELPKSVSVQHLTVTSDVEQITEPAQLTARLEIAIYAPAPVDDDEELAQDEEDFMEEEDNY